MKALLDWLDQRTGCREIAQHALYENVPGGARWRYVWGSTLTFTLVVQFITGIFLWMSYSPSSQTAWESVYFIQFEMSGGWMLRGIHHFTAQAMNVLLVLHLMQVIIDGAYKAPRELNFWFGMGLLLLVLGLSLTGYLLPWDQKGYWATKVATNIAGISPLIGPQLQRIIVGGADYGHHTLTRFFALHAGVIPGSIIALLVAHIYLFRRHGLTARQPQRAPDAPFWPDQVFKDAVACLAVLAAVLFLVVRYHGADLGAPADPSEQYDARPEWYFLFLFQFLKYFPGTAEIWGAIVIPTVLLGVVTAMPIIGRWRLGHRFNVGLLFSLLAGVGLLTWLAMAEDRHDPAYQTSLVAADRSAERAQELARSPTGIPATGAVGLLRDDPLIQGPRIFARNCASCHRFDGHDGLGKLPADAPSASDLKGFASRTWLTGLLNPDKIGTTAYFGATQHKDGKMVRFVRKELGAAKPERRELIAKAILALSAEAQLKAQRVADAQTAGQIAEGRALIKGEELRCTECHSFGKVDEDSTAPELTGYGSRDWLIRIISDPRHERAYGKHNDRMPAFGTDGVLDAKAIGLVADWLRGDWYVPGETAENH